MSSLLLLFLVLKNKIFLCKSELKFSQHGCTESKPSTTNFIIYPEIVTQNFVFKGIFLPSVLILVGYFK